LGDFRFSGDVRLAGEYGGPATLAIGAQLYLPTGSRTSFTGDGKVRFVPHVLLAGRNGRFDYSARLGLAFRAQHDEIAGVPFGSEIAFALSAGVSALDHRLLFGPELSGSTTLVDGSAFKKATTPVELLFGLHYQPKDFRTGIGIGPGLSRGLGSPTVRVVAMLEWAPSADSDRDHDGVFDVDDACPDLPGAMNADPAKNGCPILADRDQDGVPDAQDACPELVGVPSSDPEKNGCPLSDDRDGDGVPDSVDECPDVPGVPSAVPQFNGCPADIDADGILNPLDACPTIPGVSDPDPLVNGCPLARIEKNQIIITQRIEFEFESATLLASSVPVLTAVLDIMRGHPELGIVLVEGHTDSIGAAAYNKGLSERRAQSVRTWLVEHGVARARLLDAGFGLERPIDTNGTPEGRQRNRRVEFHIIERDGKRLETVGSEVIHVR
jgi:outer membrane protein OmpA-like peptidoglycan-associated protein